MELRKTNEMHGVLLTVAASLILLAVTVLSIGTAYARYETTLYGVGIGTVLSKVSATVAVTKTSSTEWIAGEKSSYLDFSVSNLDASKNAVQRDFAVRVRLFIPEAVVSQGNLRVVLALDDRSYEATAVPLSAGTQIYAEAGAGSVYCFCDSDGSELNWLFSAGNGKTLTMKLTVVNGTDASGFRLYTETVQVP